MELHYRGSHYSTNPTATPNAGTVSARTAASLLNRGSSYTVGASLRDRLEAAKPSPRLTLHYRGFTYETAGRVRDLPISESVDAEMELFPADIVIA